MIPTQSKMGTLYSHPTAHLKIPREGIVIKSGTNTKGIKEVSRHFKDLVGGRTSPQKGWRFMIL